MKFIAQPIVIEGEILADLLGPFQATDGRGDPLVKGIPFCWVLIQGGQRSLPAEPVKRHVWSSSAGGW